MKNVSYLYKNLPSPLTKRITWPQTTVFWLGNTATTSSCSTALLPPVTSPLGQPIPPIIESSIRVGSRALQKPRAYDCRETVGLGRLVPELLLPWDIHCFPLVENSKHRELGCPSTEQLCAVGVSTTGTGETLRHCCHSGSTGSWNPPDSLRPSKLCLAASTQRKLWNSC